MELRVEKEEKERREEREEKEKQETREVSFFKSKELIAPGCNGTTLRHRLSGG